jgi:nitronate monooxygenase
MGTAFLACTESGIHQSYKNILLNTHHDNTTLTRAFSGKLARGINNQFISKMKSMEEYILDYPIQNKLTSTLRKEAGKMNNTDFMSLWAGQGAYLCKNLSATELMQQLKDEMLAIL